MSTVTLKKDTGKNFVEVVANLFNSTEFDYEHNYGVAFLNNSDVTNASKGYNYLHFLYNGKRDMFHKCLENSGKSDNPKFDIKFTVKQDAPSDAKKLKDIISNKNNAIFMDWNEMILYYVEKDGKYRLKVFRLNEPSNTDNKSIL